MIPRQGLAIRGRLEAYRPSCMPPGTRICRGISIPVYFPPMTQPATPFRSVWDALADSPEQAANLRARADLMRRVADFITAKGWTQVEAAERCGVSQPRINDLMNGRLSRFSLDALVNIAAALGFRVKVSLRAA